MSDAAQRGIAAVNRDDMAEAARCFQEAVRQNPADAGSRAWLGQCLCSLGRRAEGIPELREAGRQFIDLARQSRDVSVLLELTGEMQHWSDFEGARELGEATVSIAPNRVEGYQHLALTYGQLNQGAEAVAMGRRALALAPQDMAMRVLLASLEADAGERQAARTRLEAVLQDNPEPRHAYRALKELARVLDRLGERDQVFRHLHAASALTSSLEEFTEHNRATMPAIVASNRAGFDRSVLARWSAADFAADRPAPAFVMGFMRSGTTLTQEVLGAHPEVFVSDEVDFISETLRELHRVNPARLGTADKLRQLDLGGVRALRAFYWSQVEQRHGRVAERVFVDKFTMNTIDVGLIGAIFPDARLVFVQRDPRDICLSCYMQLMVPSPTTVQLADWQNTARFYAQVIGWWQYIRPQLSCQVLQFRYEDAVTAFEATFRGIFEFLGLEWDPRVVEFHRLAQGRHIATPSRAQVAQPLYDSSVGRWRDFASEFVPVSGILRPFVQSLGYPPF